MNKIYLLFFILTSLLLFGCSKKEQSFHLDTVDLLSIAYSHSLIHIQTQSEIRVLKKNKVKATSVIIEGDKSEEPDSTTFLQYDRNGRLISRTTSECSSMGCLPYDIRQTFIYSNDTIRAMNDYFFKYKKKSTLEYWLTKDTSNLRFVYDELYTYKNDTIIVDEMPAIIKYVKDKKGRIIEVRLDIKTNDQFSVNKISYTDSTILRNAANLHGLEIKLKYTYNKKSNCVYLQNINGKKLIKWSFNSNGLPVNITNYNNGKISSKEVLKYYFYKS